MMHMSRGAPPVSQVFQVLGDPTRLRVLALLAATRERACVCELCDALAAPQYHVSRHLRVLVDAGLLRRRREGRWVYYRLAPLPAPFGRRLRALLRALPDPEATLAADRRRFLARLRLRRDGRCCVWRVGQGEHRLLAS